MKIDYILDTNVDEQLDYQLRQILSTCFNKPHEARFKTQRYFFELPKHRWVMFDDTHSTIIAHAAIHEKIINVSGRSILVGGIAEVCVHPDHRKKGYVSQLMKRMHQYLSNAGITYSILFGEAAVYGSIGYQNIENLMVLSDGNEEKEEWKIVPAMVYELTHTLWPNHAVYLQGKTF